MFKLIKKIPLIGPLLEKVYLHFLRKANDPAYWMEKLAPRHHAQIIQIGANDGIHGDPIHDLLRKHPDWNALFVEAVPYICERLKQNYVNKPDYRFCNVAINEGEDGVFYWVDPVAQETLGNLPEYFDQLGSFDRNHILKHLDGVLEPFIREMPVAGTRLNELLEKEQIQQIDILNVDTEGYDWKILSQLDLERYRPAVIFYEHTHLEEEELQASFRRFRPYYHLYYADRDILAICRKRGFVLPAVCAFFGRRLNLRPIREA